MKGKALPLLVFLLLSALLGGFLLLMSEARGFTFFRPSFEPSAVSFVLLAGLIFMFLVALWAGWARLASRFFGPSEAEALEGDFPAYLPLLMLSFAPLTLRHFIGGADLAARLRLFLAAVVVSVLYLKAVQVKRWSEAGSPFRPSWKRRYEGLSTRRRVAFLFLVSLLVFNAGAFLMVSAGANFSGDEPHYLLIGHSLLKDGDFDLANNYARRDYSHFMKFEGRIEAHAVPGAKPGTRFSFHSPGVSFLMLPFYALGAWFKGKTFVLLIRLGMSLWGAFFSVQVYLYALSEWRKEGPALRLWLLAGLTTPVFFYSIHVYPEIIVAGLSLAVFRMVRFSPAFTMKRAAVCGLFLGSFFWFHALKYIALFVPLFLYGLWGFTKKPKSRLPLAAYISTAAVVIFAYLQFQHALYGTYSLSTVSWAAQMTDTGEEFARFARSLLFEIPLKDRWGTLAGYFLDQRDGLLFYAPVYFYALLGAVEMLRRKRRDFWLLLGMTAPYVLLSAFLTQRTGYAPQARPLVAVIWWLIIWLGYFLVHDPKTLFSRLLSIDTVVSFVFVFLLLQAPFSLYQETTRGQLERGGGLFFTLSNLHFHLTDLLPSYIKSGEGAWLPNLFWPAAVALWIAVYAISKKRPFTMRAHVRTLLVCAGLGGFFVWLVLYPRLILRQPTYTGFGPGKRVTFYSLSRSARMTEPGEFALREDGRSYRFYMTTEQPIEELRLSLGSLQGTYDFSVSLFDEVLVRGRTVGEIREFKWAGLPRYKLGKESFYTFVLELGKDPDVRADLIPFLFNIDF
jgi:hypothetical protein